MNEYYGMVEVRRLPYFENVRIFAADVASAKAAYESYCAKIGGYVWNLYPVNEGNRAKFQEIDDCSPIPVPTIYA